MYQAEGLNVIYLPFILFEDNGKSIPFHYSILNFAILMKNIIIWHGFIIP